ncbi:hypothetical protein ACF05T_12395 [Streptomyces lateritius]|uniref:Uncharacterized protein n=1 Tax=Streptomyces lateritius TaxID=67313 RepID=A0ABW6YAP3_9ACTN
MSSGAMDGPPEISGSPQFAVRTRTVPGGEVWFTCGQGWEFDSEGGKAFAIRMTMTPVNWEGELLLMPIQEELRTDPED